jgi:hypothetical protein
VDKPRDAVRILRLQYLGAREMQDVPRQDRPWYAASVSSPCVLITRRTLKDHSCHLVGTRWIFLSPDHEACLILPYRYPV